MESNNPNKFWNTVNELRTAKQNNYIDNIELKKWYSWCKELNAAKKQVEGDNFDKNIEFVIKSFNLFTAGNDNPLFGGAITIPEIKGAGKKLKNNKACGQDMINNEMIKCTIGTRFIEIILHVFNLIFDKSQFPEIWKIGYIVPIFKGDDSSDPSNYSGIAITSCSGKLFSLILNDRLVAFLQERKILKPNEIGFRKRYGTADHVFVLNPMINS